VLLLLCDPEKILIEFCELFKNRPFSRVLAVVLGHLDDGVDHPHDEIGVVPIGRKEYLGVVVVGDIFGGILFSQREVVADHDAVTVDEIVLLIVHAVDLVDDVAHAKRPSRGSGHWVMVGQVAESVSEDAVELGDEDSPFSLFDPSLGLGMLLDSTGSALVGGVEVQGDVLNCVLLGLPRLEFSPTEKLEGSGGDVSGGLHQEPLELLLDGFVQLALQECLTLRPLVMVR
jgi:hypothetical protein